MFESHHLPYKSLCGPCIAQQTLGKPKQRLVLCISILILWNGHAGVRSAETPGLGGSALDLSRCPSLRLAIINGVPYHYEVLAGLLHVLRPYSRHTDVFINSYTRSPTADGAWDILRRYKFNFQLLTRRSLSSIAQRKPSYDLVILVSPDYELDANAELLKFIQRRLTVAIVHNADYNETTRLIHVAEGGGSGLQLVTLAPHTARSLAAAAGRPVEWVLATYPYKPQTNCLQAPEVNLLGMCLKGFSIQGKFSNLRRNYSTLWSQMQDRHSELTQGAAGRLFQVNVLGKGVDARLGVPPELQPHVVLRKRLPFRAFFESIHHTLALLPVFGSPRYYTDKFSSTIFASLISGTPMVADQRFLDAYGMFGPESVYLQGKGEREVDVMLRVLRTPARDLLATRLALLDVRRRVNERAASFYGKLIAGLCMTNGKGSGVGTERAT